MTEQLTPEQQHFQYLFTDGAPVILASEDIPLAPKLILLPDVLPEVTFDTRIGKKVGHVDFDYAAYVAHLREDELTDDQIAETKVRFQPSTSGVSKFLPNGQSGSYGSKRLDVELGRRQKQANRYLVHETQHRIDDATGVDNAETDRRYNRMDRTSSAAIWTGQSLVLGGVSGEFLGRLHIPYSKAILIGSAVLAAAGMITTVVGSWHI